ncbi:MAG: hypothetical protein K0R38_6716 [Polyangiaceae bacterium]|nr:hypothetical protein [Polyangiaceae bacterium]
MDVLLAIAARRRAALILAAAASIGCLAKHPPVARPRPTPAAPAARLAHDPSALHRSLDHYDFATQPHLLQRIAASPFQYFRFTNPGFAAAICAAFEDILPALPAVNLHGDAHLEQFAVTDASFGLVDFDDAVGGPAVIDLLRFGVSLQIAARERGWTADEAPNRFFAGYQAALEAPATEAPPPAFVARARQSFARDPKGFIARCDALMEPPLARDQAETDAGLKRYVEVMLEQSPELTPAFFEMKRYGRLRGGVGSALDQRFLIRIEGPTRALEDDVVLEAKELRELRSVPCVQASLLGGRFRTIVGSARLGGNDDPFLAVVPRGPEEAPDDPPFWVQSWQADYRELDVAHDLTSADELAELAYQVGLQLGRGHIQKLATPFDYQLRRAVRDMLRDYGPRIRATVDSMTERTLASFQQFRDEAARDAP